MITSTTSTSSCPSCSGPRLPRHPLGLVFRHVMTCALLAAEDATQAADVAKLRATDGVLPPRRFTRPTTTAERTLLAACGVVLPEVATTTVERVTGSLRRRRWVGVALDG